MPTKHELTHRIAELELFNHRLEASNADLRFRNGELSATLQEVDIDAFDSITPYSYTNSRHNMLLGLVETAIDWADTSSPSKLIQLRDRAESIRDFLAVHLENRRVLSDEHIAAMQTGRKSATTDL